MALELLNELLELSEVLDKNRLSKMRTVSKQPEGVPGTSGDIVSFIEKETHETQNSDSPAADKARAASISKVIKIVSKGGATLDQAQSALDAAIKAAEYSDMEPPRKQGALWGTFEAWRAAVKFLGGKLDKNIANANFLDDLY